MRPNEPPYDIDDYLAESTHDRWMAKRNRQIENIEYKDQWYSEQCLHCRFYVPLSGKLGSDYGGCLNSLSPFDGRVMFEHDGCNAFEAAPDEAFLDVPE